MTFEHITTWEAAVTYINAHSGMTEQQLMQLLHQMKVDAPAGAQVKMLYSGEVWGGKHSEFFIEELQKTYNNELETKIITIGDTDFGKLADNITFENALRNSFGLTDPNAIDARFNEVMFGEQVIDGVTVRTPTGAWDIGSERFIKTGNLPIQSIVVNPDLDRVWGATEVKAMLESNAPTIEGIATSHYQQMFQK